MADFRVNTKFTATDNIGKFFKKSSAGAKKFGDDASRAFRKASRSGSRFGDIVKGVLSAQVIGKGIGLMTRGLREVTTQFISFDDAIVSASAKFSDLNLVTAAGQKKLQELRDVAREVGATTEFTATQAAQGLDFLALAGFNAEQSMATLPGTVDLATVAQIDLARATDIASDALGAFDLLTKDTNQLQKNFIRLNDVMAKTMTSTNTNIEDMFDSMKKGGPLFTQAGQSIETFNALVGIMASSGVKGSESGTQLRNVILRLADATPQAKRVLDSLGISVADSTGRFRDVVDILADFEMALVGVESAQRLQILSTIFGARSITGISLLLSKGTREIRAFRDQLLAAAGSTQFMADIMRASLGNQLKALGSAALEVGFKILDAFATKGSTAIKDFTAFLRKVDVGPFIRIMKSLVTTFGNLFKVIDPVVKVLVVVLLPILETLSGVLAQNSDWISTLVVVLGSYVLALRAVGAAQAFVAATNPFILIGVAIGLAIIGMHKLITNWDKVVAFFERTIKRIVDFLQPVFDLFAGFFKAMGLVASSIGIDFSGISKIGEIGTTIASNFPKAISAISSSIEAPNQSQVNSSRDINFNGQLSIAHAPTGSTFEGKTTGGRAVDVSFAGANP